MLDTQRHIKWKHHLWAGVHHIHGHTIFCTIPHLCLWSAENPFSHLRYLSRTFPSMTPSLCVKRDGQNGPTHESPLAPLGLQRSWKFFSAQYCRRKAWDRPHRQLFSSWHICSGVHRRLEVWCLLFFVNVMLKCWWLGFSSCIQSKVPTGRRWKAKLRIVTSENWNHWSRWSFIFSYAALHFQCSKTMCLTWCQSCSAKYSWGIKENILKYIFILLMYLSLI